MKMDLFWLLIVGLAFVTGYSPGVRLERDAWRKVATPTVYDLTGQP